MSVSARAGEIHLWDISREMAEEILANPQCLVFHVHGLKATKYYVIITRGTRAGLRVILQTPRDYTSLEDAINDVRCTLEAIRRDGTARGVDTSHFTDQLIAQICAGLAPERGRAKLHEVRTYDFS